MKHIQPLKDRVAIRLDEAPAMSSVIHIPGTVQKQKSMRGVVVAIGPKVKLPICVGDTVLVEKHAGVVLKQGGVSVSLYEEVDVVALVTPEKGRK